MATGKGTIAAIGLAIALGVIALVTTGGEQGVSAANTWTEIVLVLLCSAAACRMLLGARDPRGRDPGSGARGRDPGFAAIVLFAGVAGLTALSIAWSVEPDQSWIEAGRTLGFVAAFALAFMAARAFGPRGSAAIVGGIALASVAVSLWAVIVKVFTLQIDQQVQYGRLLAPFDYWNATGLMAALGLPALVWAAGRREAGRVTRTLAVPGIALLITVVLLTYSRSALAAAVLGTAVPLTLGRARLRSVLMLAVAGAGAAIVCVWALDDRSVTGASSIGLAARTSGGRALGLVLLVVLVALAGAGWAATRLTDRTTFDETRRRMIGTALVGLLSLVPLAGLVALLVSARGLTGEVSHIWTTLTSTSGHVGDSASRLVDLANSRPLYWHQGVSVGEHHLLAGAGAGSFAVAETHYPTRLLTAAQAVPNAHSYAVETFADFGLIGLALNIGLLIAWVSAVVRALGRRHRPERDALVALLGVAIAYGASSAIDWTWFFPGLTVPAMIAAGWLAGRAAPSGVATAVGVGAGGVDQGGTAARARRALGPAAILGATATAIVALVLAFAIWQPLRSFDADRASALAGDAGVALSDARAAVSEFPVSLAAIQQLAYLEGAAGLPGAEEAELTHGTVVQPGNPQAWQALGQYQYQHGQYARAEVSFRQEATDEYDDPLVHAEVLAATAAAAHG